jgi:hypothetical protein
VLIVTEFEDLAKAARKWKPSKPADRSYVSQRLKEIARTPVRYAFRVLAPKKGLRGPKSSKNP